MKKLSSALFVISFMVLIGTVIAVDNDEYASIAESYVRSDFSNFLIYMSADRCKLHTLEKNQTCTDELLESTTAKVEFVESQNLWFVQLGVKYQLVIDKEYVVEGKTANYKYIDGRVYIDGSTKQVIPSLSKIERPEAFMCSDKGYNVVTESFYGCNGLFITFDPRTKDIQQSENILITKNDAKKLAEFEALPYTSAWYVHASELRNIANYDFVAEISPSVYLFSQSGPSNGEFLLILAVSVLFAVVLIAIVLTKRRKK